LRHPLLSARILATRVLVVSCIVVLAASVQCRADEKRPEKLGYSADVVENPQNQNFAAYWGDQLNRVEWTSQRPVTVFGRYFFNADGRRLFISMLSAAGACGTQLCPVRIFTETGKQVTEISACDQADTHEISADRTSFVACGVASAIPQAGPPGSLETNEVRQYSHNGSVMQASFYKNGTIRIEYDEVRRGLPPALQGEVLFKGVADGQGSLSGTAYTFKSGCHPAPYAVEGRIDPKGGIVLTGDAPMRDGKSCDIVGFTGRSPNARLTFVEIAQGD
jgi:hypothetical protein